MSSMFFTAFSNAFSTVLPCCATLGLPWIAAALERFPKAPKYLWVQGYTISTLSYETMKIAIQIKTLFKMHNWINDVLCIGYNICHAITLPCQSLGSDFIDVDFAPDVSNSTALGSWPLHHCDYLFLYSTSVNAESDARGIYLYSHSPPHTSRDWLAMCGTYSYLDPNLVNYILIRNWENRFGEPI